MRTPRALMVIDNVNMGLGHDGLTLVAKRFRVDPARLSDYELLIFINRAKDKMKIMGMKGHVLGYYKTKQKITMEALQFIPQTFNPGGHINYDDALRMALERMLARRSRRDPLAVYRAMEKAGVTANA